MNKKIWFNYSDDLPCPRCEEGTLREIQKDVISETLDSLIDNEYHKNGIVYPETTRLGTSHLQCHKCKDAVVMTYVGSNDVRHTDEMGNEYNRIEPLSYYPPPPIIHIPVSCPIEIKTILKKSFGLFWIDLGSCANKIRIAVEALMNYYGIDHKLVLHKRVEKFGSTNAKVSGYLIAIKIIGNDGSHHSTVNKGEVLDAYELLEYSLELLFNDREKGINEISNRIKNGRKSR